ncbi:Cyclopropane-fatty-acyl-phospholipid synthase [Enhydrobacter sp. AX1]|nr:cyclopropane-fatty-acyl-phospholipid synthase family protein [Enhydrobacter sp. AX1]VXB13802.1 Cyclopropane-fatty-acyl-phospholipid synthase [Enhydrobacter sp. AX1]
MTPSSLEAKNTATSHPSNHLSKGKETLVKRRQSDLAKRRSFTDFLPYPIVDHLLTPVQQSAAKAARQIIFLLLSKLKQGHLTVIETFHQSDPVATKVATKAATHKTFGVSVMNTEPLTQSPVSDTQRTLGEQIGNHPLAVTLTIHSPQVYQHLLTGGSIAFADDYIDGLWQADDLTAFLRLIARNLTLINTIEAKFANVTKRWEHRQHRNRHNDKRNAKSNILAHYDIGNAMYALFLDERMMYSSAIYPTPSSSLAVAQTHKLAKICELAELTADDHIIEIGTGWGGFAIYAATQYGCRVTTTTISDAQYEEAKRRIAAANLTDKITLLKQDYRELTGKYDKLVSIEMIEAVGHEYLPDFFAQCNRLLKDNGLMVLQAITFNDRGYQKYLHSVDFIQTHVFPGGCLLSNSEILSQARDHTDMQVTSLVDYGYDYARTLIDWRYNFMQALPQLKALGYDDAFMRLWHFYFAYCEAGFLEKTIGVVQVRLEKAQYR